MITAGTSMLPMLRDRKDTAVFVEPTFPLRKYDVILYRRKDGSFVLHRIVGKDQFGYILCGDNQYFYEHGIKDNQVIAELSAYIKDGKRVECTSFKNRFYSFFHCNFRFVRQRLSHIKGKLKKIISGT